jgi:hypothetical protein
MQRNATSFATYGGSTEKNELVNNKTKTTTWICDPRQKVLAKKKYKHAQTKAREREETLFWFSNTTVVYIDIMSAAAVIASLLLLWQRSASDVSLKKPMHGKG